MEVKNMANITAELLSDFAKKFAAKCTAIFAKKKEIPTKVSQLTNDSGFKTTDTTYSNMGGATASDAGKAGLVPAPAAGAANRYLRSDGTWEVPPDNNTTYSDMKGASTTAAGTKGLVPAPAKGDPNRYLRSDGTWQEIKEATTDDIDAIIAETFKE